MEEFIIKDHLIEKCRERNLSLAELSRRTGIDYTGLSKRNNFTLKNVCKMMIVLDCKFEDLFEIVKR